MLIFGLILDLEVLQFRNEATCLTPNTNYGAPMRDYMFSHPF